jgi:hypothetical protein
VLVTMSVRCVSDGQCRRGVVCVSVHERERHRVVVVVGGEPKDSLL